VCDLVITNDQAKKKIGGVNHIVEVDEAHLHTRKNHIGRTLGAEKFWVFGGVSQIAYLKISISINSSKNCFIR
jgi:hypothetical protein